MIEIINHDVKDDINHPKHYISGGLEAIDVIEAFTTDLTGIEATDTANIIKYALRWKMKDGVKDLKKLVWYANHLISHLEADAYVPIIKENIHENMPKDLCNEFSSFKWNFVDDSNELSKGVFI